MKTLFSALACRTNNTRLLPLGGRRITPAWFQAGVFIAVFPWCYNTTMAGVSGLAVITVQPVAATVNLGGNATFSVAATSVSELSYQWRRNNVALDGATNSTLTIQAAQLADAGVYTVVVSNASGSVTSRPALLTILVPPTVANPPDNVSVTAGHAATFRVTATGTPVLFYQWEMSVGGGAFANVTNGPLASGANSSTLIFRNTTLANNGTLFRVRIANLAGVAVSANAILQVGVAPSIETPPEGATVVIGGTATFSVTATGSGTLHYQWRRNNRDIEGATGATLSVNNASQANVGAYSVVVRNDFGATVSAPVFLRVAIAPQIVVPPSDTAVIAGRPAVFRARASGSARLTYQWQVMTTGSSGFVNLTANASVIGTTSPALVIRRTTIQDDDNVYRVIVSNDVGTAISAGAELNVGTPPRITVQPQTTQVVAGGTIALSAEGTGSGPLNFQWLHNNVVIEGETAAELTITGATTGDQGVYRVVVRNAFGVAISQNARVLLAIPPAITDQPDDTGVVTGRPAVFRVRATGTARLMYQWQVFNGEDFDNLSNGSVAIGVNSAVLIYRGTSLAANGTLFRVVVTNGVGAETSADATLTVGSPPVITTAPQSLTVVAGADAILNVEAGGTGPLQYQWLRNNVAISGATSATLDLSPADAQDAGIYSVRVTNDVGVAASRPVRVVVTPEPQGIFVGGFVGAGGRGGMAALVQTDGDAVVLGFNHEHDEGLLAANADVALNGSFSANTSPGGTVSGTVGARLLSGTFADGEGHSENFIGVRRPDTGAQAAVAGYYVGTFESEDDTGDVFAIVAADGAAFFYFVSSETGDEGGAFVRVAANGNLTGLLVVPAGIIHGVLDRNTATITGTYNIGLIVQGTFTLHRVFGQ